MTSTKQVKSCIEKAVKSGWHKDKIKGRRCVGHKHNDGTYHIFIDSRTASPIYLGTINEILFSKSFLKAFAKYIYEHSLEKKLEINIDDEKYENTEKVLDAIEKQLSIELVLSDDRLAYLSKFL